MPALATTTVALEAARTCEPRHPVVEAEAIDHHQRGGADLARVRGARLEGVGVLVGADQGAHLDALAADLATRSPRMLKLVATSSALRVGAAAYQQVRRKPRGCAGGTNGRRISSSSDPG